MTHSKQKSVVAWKHRGWLTLLGAVCIAFTMALEHTSLFQKVHLKARDLNYFPRRIGLVKTPVPSAVKLITIDQKSLDDVALAKPLMFWHQFHAEVIRAAAEGGQRVRGINAKQAAARYSRKGIDELTQMVKQRSGAIVNLSSVAGLRAAPASSTPRKVFA